MKISIKTDKGPATEIRNIRAYHLAVLSHDDQLGYASQLTMRDQIKVLRKYTAEFGSDVMYHLRQTEEGDELSTAYLTRLAAAVAFYAGLMQGLDEILTKIESGIPDEDKATMMQKIKDAVPSFMVDALKKVDAKPDNVVPMPLTVVPPEGEKKGQDLG